MELIYCSFQNLQLGWRIVIKQVEQCLFSVCFDHILSHVFLQKKKSLISLILSSVNEICSTFKKRRLFDVNYRTFVINNKIIHVHFQCWLWNGDVKCQWDFFCSMLLGFTANKNSWNSYHWLTLSIWLGLAICIFLLNLLFYSYSFSFFPSQWTHRFNFD